MRIGDSSAPKATTQTSAAPASSAAKPEQLKMSGDKLSVSTPPVKVVTYNAGSDDAKHGPQGDYVGLSFFKDVINGKADAPIVSCQEAGPELSKRLQELAKETGNFEVYTMEKSWLPDVSPLNTQNLVVVPKRYKIEHEEQHTYKGRLGQLWSEFKGWAFGDTPANNMLLATQKRGYEELRLKDTQSGKSFNLINTHVAYYDPTRRQEAPQLVAAIKKAEAEGPTIVTGDFNTPTLDTAVDPNAQGIKDFWKTLEPAHLTDMGPAGAAGASNWHNGEDIDHVLANGFTSEDSHMYKGKELSIPGYPDAQDLSDHYAEGDTLQFKNP